MASDPSLERRVTRLENDTLAIYEILTEHSQRFDAFDARLDVIDGRLDGIDGRLDGIDATLTEVLRRLPEPA